MMAPDAQARTTLRRLAAVVAAAAACLGTSCTSMATADPHHNITFRPPVYLGAVGWGLTDTVNFGNGTFAVVVAGAAGVGTRTLLSRNGGVAYTNAANATAVLGTNTIRMPGQYPTAHDFGTVGNGALRSPTARYWELRGRQETEVHTYTRDTPVVFQGLPMHLKCDAKYSTCPIRLQGSGAVRFGDGTLLQSAIVYTAARGDATSVVCFRSTDGLRWTYTGTIANASNYTASEEGPNENDLAMLDFGVVLAVIRTDGGDGLPGHVYKSYSYSYSMDGGFTWTPLAAMPGTGCARPRLLMLGGGFAPLLMSGGKRALRWHVIMVPARPDPLTGDGPPPQACPHPFI